MIIMLMKKFSAVALGVAVLLGAAACGSGVAANDKVSIIASNYPFEFVVDRIVGDKAEVTTLVPPGVEAHDYELTPKQVAAINAADLVVFQSGMTSAIDDAVSASTNENILDTASTVTLLPIDRDEEADHDHDEADGHDHDHGNYDPHIWLDPNNLKQVADAVLERLIEIDAQNADYYKENARLLVSDLSELDDDFKAGLANCERTEFVTSHAAFGYLAHAYDLRQLAISGVTPESSPSPARMADIQFLAKEYGITTIFTETLASPALSETLARDLGLVTDVLDPIEGLSAQSRGNDYLEIMRANLDALRKANDCRN